jgi:hypothetical protein
MYEGRKERTGIWKVRVWRMKGHRSGLEIGICLCREEEEL